MILYPYMRFPLILRRGTVQSICMKKLCILAYLKYTSEDSDQTANVRADLNLRWAHMSKGMFSYIVAQIIQNRTNIIEFLIIRNKFVVLTAKYILQLNSTC